MEKQVGDQIITMQCNMTDNYDVILHYFRTAHIRDDFLLQTRLCSDSLLKQKLDVIGH